MLNPRIRGVTVVSAIALLASAAAHAATVKVDTAQRRQTIIGWGGTASKQHADDGVRGEVLDVLVNDLGLTGQRLEPPSGNRASGRGWEFDNDDADPRHIRWQAFATTQVDDRVGLWVAPFRRLVEARKEKPYLYVSPSFFDGGSSGTAPPWLLNDPQEYAEFAVAFLTRLRDRWQITPDAWSVCNEAGNNNAFSPQVMARMIAALGPRLAEANFPVKIQYSEGVNSGTTWRYIQQVQHNADVWRYVGMLSYHLYGDRSRRPAIRDFAAERKLPVAQTEFMGTRVDDLYEDLTDGGVSYWEHYVMCGLGNQAANGCYLAIRYDGTSLARYGEYWRFRQVMHYVRPGAVRVEASSDTPAVRPLAFDHDGRVTVVALNTTKASRAEKLTVQGLPAGRYGVCRAVGSRAYEEVGAVEVSKSGELTMDLPANSVATIYPHPGGNTLPTITDWRATPTFLTFPADRVRLSAAATDAERDRLSFVWELANAPRGVLPMISAPNSAETEVTGLGAAGDYGFTVTVGDGQGKSTRHVRLIVHAGNQPPNIADLHNRLPVQPTAAGGKTALRAFAWDLEGDPLTFRWEVLRQPAGVAAALASPDKPACDVTGLTVAGEYVFRLTVRDPTHSASRELHVPVR